MLWGLLLILSVHIWNLILLISCRRVLQLAGGGGD
jgi:hypothetical protein